MVPTAVVVDDSKTMRSVLRMALTRCGFEVVAEGCTGEAIFQLYEQHRPTLMTLDIVLPGIDGVAGATQVLAKYPDATIAMCSSLTARDKILAARSVGVKHFILKPFTVERISELAKVVLAAKTATPEAPVMAVAL